MKARSAKNKGDRFENFLVEQFRTIDPETKRNYGSGNGLDKGDLRVPLFDLNVEAKNKKTVTLVSDWEQAQRQCISGGTPILALRNPKEKEFDQTFIVMDLDDFIELLDSKTEYEKDSKLENKDRYVLTQAKNALIQVIKVIDKLL